MRQSAGRIPCSIFWFIYFAGSISGYTALNGNMTHESERIWSRAVMTLLKHYPDICLLGLRNAIPNFYQDSWCPG